MNDTAKPPVKARVKGNAELVTPLEGSPKRLLLDTLDVLNRFMELTDLWIYQARAISILAQEQSNDRDYKLFPQMMAGVSEMLYRSINNDTVISDCAELIIDVSSAAEKASCLPAHS